MELSMTTNYQILSGAPRVKMQFTHLKQALRFNAKGENSKLAKLTNAEVIEIRELSKKPRGSRITLKEIAKNYGISLTLIAKIRTGKREARTG